MNHRHGIRDIEGLLDQGRERVLFECVAGSRAYGTAGAASDEDIRGVYVEPTACLLTLNVPPQQVSDARGDVVFYTLRRFLDLALSANPNVIELLFAPSDCVRRYASAFAPVMEARSLFLTRETYASHARYAAAQIRKARGRNKWVNHPQPEKPPEPRDFCWFVAAEPGGGMPFRPIPMDRSGIDPCEFRAASMEHAPGVYRIYRVGPGRGGLFRGGIPVCESVSLEEERRCFSGLLVFDRAAYERANRDHRHYWEWRRNRNDSRWTAQENGERDYDAKNMMHLFRLLMSAQSILEAGYPIVRFQGAELEFLRDVLGGRFEYGELLERADAMLRHLKVLEARCDLPDRPGRDRAERLLREVTRRWEEEHGNDDSGEA